jgi:hypothetical protein
VLDNWDDFERQPELNELEAEITGVVAERGGGGGAESFDEIVAAARGATMGDARANLTAAAAAGGAASQCARAQQGFERAMGELVRPDG